MSDILTLIFPLLLLFVTNMLQLMSSYGSALIISRNVIGRNCRIGKKDIVISFAAANIMNLIVYAIQVAIYAIRFLSLAPGLTDSELADAIGEYRLSDNEYEAYSYISLACLFAVFFVTFLLKYKYKRFSSALLSSLIFISIGIGEQNLINNILLLISNDWQKSLDLYMYSAGTEASSTLHLIISSLVQFIIFLILYIAIYKKGKMLDIKPVYIIVLCVLFLAVTSSGSIPFSKDFPEEQITYYARIMLAVFIPLILLSVTLILILNKLREDQKAANEYQAQYLEAELAYIAQYKKNVGETRKFRHDIINNLSLMEMMVNDGHIEEAREHLKQMLENINSLSHRFATGDEMLDLIVNMKASAMEDGKIAFQCSGSLDGGLDMKPFDICGVFAGALDNAIAESKSCETPEINMSISETEDSRIISIRNNFTEGSYGDKAEKLNEECIKAYGGSIRTAVRDNISELILTLPRQKRGEAVTA